MPYDGYFDGYTADITTHNTNDYNWYPILNYNNTGISSSIFVTQNDLDLFAKKIYKIITTHSKIDITEDEFMDLIRGKDE